MPVSTSVSMAVAVAIAAGALAACGRTPRTASEAAVQFYTVLDAAGVHRVPDHTQWEVLRPYLTDSLSTALAGARAARDTAERLHRDEKPPFADGDVFSSLFEGRTGYTIADTLTRGDTTLVVMRFVNDTQKPAVDWKDTVVVVRRTDRSWAIADIRYGTAWEFGFQGRLLDLLQRPQ